MLSGLLQDRYPRLFSPREISYIGSKIPLSFRVNTLRVGEQELIQRLEKRGMSLKRIPWVNHGYRIESSLVPPGATPEYLLGYYFIQDPSSMAACEALAPGEGEVVLDMTASPGGKSTYLCQMMGNRGAIIAMEKNRGRLKGLKSNIMRTGCENVAVFHMDAREVASLGLKFDRVLLDAPCTGTGVAHKSDEALKKTRMDLRSSRKEQKELLEVALKVLKEQGTMVYSTCSFLPEENEFVLDWALKEHHIELEEVEAGESALRTPYGIELSREIEKASRFYPWEHSTQGFFVARIRKL